MITVKSFSNKIKTGNTLQLYASGGTSPYTYAVTSGNGSIDSNGLYRAPSKPSVETVTVTDNVGDSETYTINVMHAIQLVADIIEHEMSLNSGQVYIYSQKFNKPEDGKIYVPIGITSEQPFFSKNKVQENGSGGLEEVMSVNVQSTLTINVISLSEEALWRKNEVIQAFKSQYAVNQRNANGFLISHIPDQMTDLSDGVDGSKIPYRFETTINIHYSDTKTKDINYYDDFKDVSVNTEA